MIEGLKGMVWGKREPDMLELIMGDGIIYGVHSTSRNLNSLHKGDEALLHTHLRTRDDGMDLYGFMEENERNAFRVLLGISSVGPKTALAILDKFIFSELLKVAETEDITALCRVPGIGKKSAGRIILELSGKFVSIKDKNDMPAFKDSYRDALEGLKAMGYDRDFLDERLTALQKKSPGLSAEEIIKRILKDG